MSYVIDLAWGLLASVVFVAMFVFVEYLYQML